MAALLPILLLIVLMYFMLIRPQQRRMRAQQALLSAKIAMSEAPAGIGVLSRVSASPDGVTIRNINIQDLVSLVYGIGKFEVFGGAMPWLEFVPSTPRSSRSAWGRCCLSCGRFSEAAATRLRVQR